MWPPAVAEQLRLRGHDVVGVAERPDLRGQADAVVFAMAQGEGRVIVTENVGDYRPLAAQALQDGRSHAGLIFTSNRRYPRHDPRTAGRMVTVLDTLLSEGLGLANREHWLA